MPSFREGGGFPVGAPQMDVVCKARSHDVFQDQRSCSVLSMKVQDEGVRFEVRQGFIGTNQLFSDTHRLSLAFWTIRRGGAQRF